MNSLNFNITLLFNEDTMEVNTVDFFAIEALRIFDPKLYQFAASNKELLTEQPYSESQDDKASRKKVIDEVLESASTNPELTLKLLKTLFPMINGLYSNMGYHSDLISSWSSDLRVCTPNHFDTYFRLTPRGDDGGVSQHEITRFISHSVLVELLERELKLLDHEGRFQVFLQAFQDITEDNDRVSKSKTKNIILAIFNVLDEVIGKADGMFNFGSHMDAMRVIRQLLIRNEDKHENFQIIKEAMEASTGISGLFFRVSLDTPDKEWDEYRNFLPKGKEVELQQLCIEKAKNFEVNKLLNNEKLLHILYRWKDWDTEGSWQKFINEVIAGDESLLLFLDKLINTTHSSSGYNYRKIKTFGYKALKSFVSENDILDHCCPTIE